MMMVRALKIFFIPQRWGITSKEPMWMFDVNYITQKNSYSRAPRYNAPRYYADSDITRSVVDPEFLPPGENVKWARLNLLRIALTILKKH